MKALVRAAILFLSPLLLLCQCAHLVQKREDYTISSEETLVNGARLTTEMMTTDGKANYSLTAMVYFVAGETETGPYKCLFTAWGDQGTHRSMTVENLTFRTASGQVAKAPSSEVLPFSAGATGQGWQSTYVVPGLLSLDHEKDGKVTLEATVRIRSKQRSVRRNVTLTLSPTNAKEVEFATIFDGLRKKE